MGCRDCGSAVDEAGPAGTAADAHRLSALCRVRPRSAVALFCVLLGVLLWCAPAFALSQRGHVFSKVSFGKKGSAEGQFSNPSGIAVNESTGDVYVIDAGNNRVERFGSSGAFLEAWGWGVTDNKPEFERCEPGKGLGGECHPGIAGTGLGQFSYEEPEAGKTPAAIGIAVDNSKGPSAGDVYVVSETAAANEAVAKFSAAGKPLGRLKTTDVTPIGGVAVDAGGNVWAYEDEQKLIDKFSGAEPNVPMEAENIHLEVECGKPGFAVDAKAEAFYVGHERQLFEECRELGPSAKAPAVIAKTDKAGEPLIEGLDGENATGLAVDLFSSQQAAGDVYVDHLTSVAAFDSRGALIQQFGSEAEIKKGSGVAVTAEPTSKVYVVDAGTSRVDVFIPAPPGAPEVNGVSSQNISTASTELKAQIDPRGAETKYFFEYGTVDCKANPGSCTKTPEGAIKAGFGDQPVKVIVEGLQSGVTYFYRVVAKNEHGEAEGAQTVNTFTTLPNPNGLLPDGRAWELVSPPEKAGAGVEAIGGTGGPGGGIIESSEDGNAVTYVTNAPIVREPEGSGSPEGTQILANRGTEAWSNQDIVTPRESGEGLPVGKGQEYHFFSSDLSFALVEPSLHHTFNGFQEPPLIPEVKREEADLYRRSNATCRATPATCYQPLVTGGPGREPLLAAEQENDLTKVAFGGKIGDLFRNEIPMATPDLNHVVFPSEVALTPPVPSAKEAEGLERLYEWSAGKAPAEQLQLASILPNGKPAPEPHLGDLIEGMDARNAISVDGSRIIWTGSSEGSSEEIEHLYLRDMNKGQTLLIDAPASGVKKLSKEEEGALGQSHVHFQIASRDGSRIFFTDTVPLTKQSQLTPSSEGAADLYVCEVVEVGGNLECLLTDLTVAQNSELAANVVGKVMGASEDGSSVYFAADGVLSANVKPGNCAGANAKEENPAAMCNLYLVHYAGTSKAWEAPRFIQRVSQEDGPDWGRTAGEALPQMTSRVSPNGRFLAFMSDQSLTGYNNIDASSGARDEEVFVYDASTQRLVCASCTPGRQPHGVHDVIASGEGTGLLIDRPLVWAAGSGHASANWLAGSIPDWTPLAPGASPYQSRYLSDQGRLFFNAADSLVPQDTNGKEDVYQYEPNGLGGCKESQGCVALISSGTGKQESAFLDASTTGNDAFFVTAAQLVAADHDNSFDIYDARVCTEASPCLKSQVANPSPCEATPEANTCKAPESPHPGFLTPLGPTGPGNVGKQAILPTHETGKSKGLTNAQKLTKALAQCRKHWKHAKKKRAACEKQAKRKYGAKKAKRATSHRRGKR
jgi:NHL repeat